MLQHLNKHIGGLRHAVCGEQFDYIAQYCHACKPAYPKTIYGLKILAQLLCSSLLAGGILLLPSVLHADFGIALRIPCLVFLALVLLFKFKVLIEWLRTPAAVQQSEEKQTARKRKVPQLDEVESMAKKIGKELDGLYEHCGESKDNWRNCKAELAELQKRMRCYCSDEVRKIRRSDLMYYRLLSLLGPTYRTTLLIFVCLIYLYIVLVGALPADTLKTVAAVFVSSFCISLARCGIGLSAVPRFAENLQKQTAYFSEFCERIGTYADKLEQRHG